MPSRPNSEIEYLSIDDDIQKEIQANLSTGRRSPYAFKDEDVVRRFDLEHDKATLMRPAFLRDTEKIVNVPAYNRYAGKTQVFSFVDNDDITRRGLHVQLVSRIARNIGRLLGLNTDLIEAIALGHDVGHTPFGHAGERFLSKQYNKQTGKYFNHNVHSVRVLDELYPRNISLQTLDGVLCHNGEFAQQKLMTGDVSTFEQLDELVERCNADEQNIKHLRPSTLEGCVVRVSDMIAYVGKDRADALSIGVIDSLDMFDSSKIGKDNARIINNITADIVNNSFGEDRIMMSDEVFEDLKLAKKQNQEIIYLKEGMLEGTSNMVESMFARMYEYLVESILRKDPSSPVIKHHVDVMARNSKSIDPEEYMAQDPNVIVSDYIASMTDNYFMNLYEHLFPDSEVDVVTRDYCANLS